MPGCDSASGVVGCCVGHWPNWSTIQKYYPEPKKRETSGFFVWSKVLLDKGITNQTIGQSLRADFPKSKPSLYNQKKEGETLIYWPSCSWRRPIGYCEWIWIRRGSMRTTVPSTRYSRAPMQSTTLRLLTLWSAGSTPRLIH